MVCCWLYCVVDYGLLLTGACLLTGVLLTVACLLTGVLLTVACLLTGVLSRGSTCSN